MKKLLTIILLFCTLPLTAEIRVFLKARHYIRTDKLILSDVTDVSGTAELAEAVKQSEIPLDMYRDGFIDRGEMENFLTGAGYEARVYGSAVRILPKSMAPKTSQTVVKGDIVDVVVRRGSVTIRMRGESLTSADEGQRLSVFVNGKKRMQGVLAADKTVMVGM